MESNDPRSYRQDSRKLISTGFKPRKKIYDAIIEITNAYKKEISKNHLIAIQ